MVVPIDAAQKNNRIFSDHCCFATFAHEGRI
jgi:hypothetical protein